MSHFAGAFVDGGCVGLILILILILIGIDGGCVSHFAQAFPYVARVDVEARRRFAHGFQSLQ